MKILLKTLLSIQFAKVLDKDGNGRISLKEIKNATLDDWFTIIQEIATKLLIAYEIIEHI